jgi:hypothetical protein
MRTARNSLVALALGTAPALAADVIPCNPVPPVTALQEPWEETTRVLAGGAVRLAVIEDSLGGADLLVLTLPPPPPPPEAPPSETAEAPADEPPAEILSDPAAPPPERTCRLVVEGGMGFAALDLASIAAEEAPEEALFRLRVPALRFIPESTELEEVTLVLSFGVLDDGLSALVAEDAPPGALDGTPDGTPDGAAPEAP